MPGRRSRSELRIGVIGAGGVGRSSMRAKRGKGESRIRVRGRV